MKLRIRAVENAVNRVEGALAEEERMAATLVGVWRYEYGSRLSEGEQRLRFELAREIHSANPDVADEVQALIADEVAYVEARAKEWLADMRPGEQRRWGPLLDSALGGIGPDSGR